MMVKESTEDSKTLSKNHINIESNNIKVSNIIHKINLRKNKLRNNKT